jgi:serine phosphatase RsbU (regulator of sigma subunit)
MNDWRSPVRILSSLLRHFAQQSKTALLTRAYLTVVVITVIDYLTGVELSLLIFYLFPIIVVSWFLGKRQGIVIALIVTVATALHDLLQVDSTLVQALQDVSHYWSFLQRGGVFLTVSYLIAALRTSENEKRGIEHRLARTVQSFLLPQTARSTGHLTCYGLCKSSDHLTGDFFDLIPLGPTKLAILIGDICGKGISAALLMAYIQGLLRSHVPFAEETLGELMGNVNRSLHLVTADDKFASLFIGIYDEEHRRLTYVNAGHNPPVIFRRSAAMAEEGRQEFLAGSRPISETRPTTPIEAVKLQNGGLLLGVESDHEYRTWSQTLQDGDVFVCHTDGVEEAMNKSEEMYGGDRLAHVVASHHGERAEEIHARIFHDIEAFVGEEHRADDMTIVVGKVSERSRP